MSPLARASGPAVAALAGLLSLSPPASSGEPSPPRTPAPRSGIERVAGVGPRPLARPEGAVVARDEAHLRSLVEASDGPAEIWLEARAYRADLKIRRPLRLRGAEGAAVEGSGGGTVIDVEAEDVVIDNLEIRGAGSKHTTEDSAVKARGSRVHVEHLLVDRTLFGVSLQLCSGCSVERSHVVGPGGEETFRGDGIKLWEAHDGVVRGNVVEDTRDVVVWYSRRVMLDGNTVRRARYGTHFMYAHDAVVRGGRLSSNVVGVFVMYSARMKVEGNVLSGARGAAGMGIGFKESDGVELRGNYVVGNSTGVYLDRTPRSEETPVTFEGNVFSINDVGLRFHASEKGARFARNDFEANGRLAEVEGGGDALGVAFSGNHFSDYEGYDLDRDGVGDVPFEQKRLSSELTDAHQQIKYFQGTAAMGLFDAAARAVPVFASRKLLVDPVPAMRPNQPRNP